MASLSINDLFVALENQIGKAALHSAAAAYLASSHEQPASPALKVVAVPPVPGAPVKIRKPQSEETKAAAALKRAATKAAKAIAAEPSAVAELSAVAAVPAPVPVPAPPADASVTGEKPKKVLSESHLAKLKAGREAALARKAAAAAAAAAEPAAAAAAEPAAEADADGHASDSSSTKKHRGRKSAAEIAAMSPEERAAYDKKAAERKAAKTAKAAAMPLPASPPPAATAAPVATESHHVFAPFAHRGVNYLRNKRGDLLTAPDADGNGGYEWVGRYDSAKSTVNTLFPKPADLEEE